MPDYTLWGLPVIFSEDVPRGQIRLGSADGPVLIDNLEVPDVGGFVKNEDAPGWMKEFGLPGQPDPNGPLTRLRCERCGSREKITLAVDPFLRDMYPELPNELSWWCEACLEKRRDDI